MDSATLLLLLVIDLGVVADRMRVEDVRDDGEDVEEFADGVDNDNDNVFISFAFPFETLEVAFDLELRADRFFCTTVAEAEGSLSV